MSRTLYLSDDIERDIAEYREAERAVREMGAGAGYCGREYIRACARADAARDMLLAALLLACEAR